MLASLRQEATIGGNFYCAFDLVVATGILAGVYARPLAIGSLFRMYGESANGKLGRELN